MLFIHRVAQVCLLSMHQINTRDYSEQAQDRPAKSLVYLVSIEYLHVHRRDISTKNRDRSLFSIN
jgi:hypothetical protein